MTLDRMQSQAFVNIIVEFSCSLKVENLLISRVTSFIFKSTQWVVREFDILILHKNRLANVIFVIYQSSKTFSLYEDIYAKVGT
jgi:hypothetical protein